MSWEDYLKNRSFRGEKPHLAAARIKGIDVSTLIPGKVGVAEETRVNGQPLSDFPGIDGSHHHETLAITATAVIIPQDLWERISELATIEFRTPDAQALYMLDSLLNPTSRARIANEISDAELAERIMRLLATSPAFRSAVRG